MRIDLSRLVRRPTPGAWKSFLKETEVAVLPLVSDARREWAPGWCACSDDFDEWPEVEYICGAINDKVPTWAALWREGNLLHFDFEQSPAEMNEAGQALLLNSIAYISRFTEDRPIAAKSSLSGGGPRRSLVASLLSTESGSVDSLATYLALGAMAALKGKDWAACRAWFSEFGGYLYPDTQGRLKVDTEAKALGTPPNSPEFFDKAIAALREDGAAAQRAAALLARYSPEGPIGEPAAHWQDWWTDHKAYVFFSETGGYQWYIDPLAKKRSVPTKDLRGPLRASP